MLIDISEKPNVKPFNYVVGPLNATKLIMNPSVITSYSIHYTKLYEKTCLQR